MHRLKVRGLLKIFHENGNDKKASVAIIKLDKIDYKTESIKKDKEAHYIIIKRLIQEEDITILNIYAPNIGAPKYTKKILIDIMGVIDRNTIIVGDFNNPSNINGQIIQIENQ